MPKNSKLPHIKNILFGGLNYIECGDEEPEIQDDRVNLFVSIRLDKHWSFEKFQLELVPEKEGNDSISTTFCAENADSKAIEKQSVRSKYLHFDLYNLPCKTRFRYQITYDDQILSFESTKKKSEKVTSILFETPPARKDPSPLKIAVGGDQERHEQFGPVGVLLGLDHHRHTRLLFEHIGEHGNWNSEYPEERPYQMFLHLGDLFNGEMFFSLTNLFRPERRVIERRVETVEAFLHHLKTDFGKPAANHLAHLGFGFYPLIDDHDTGQNNCNAPTNENEMRAREAMATAFHQFVLLPDFLKQKKSGPYFHLRVGQCEFFFLHNRYTQSPQNKAEAYLLGEEQWDWLEGALTISKASHKILVSPLPFVMGKNPLEDYRSHPDEWHRMMQLCRQYRIGTILTADSHNYSHSVIYVRENQEDEPWILHHHLIGTLGGSSQSITAEEREEISKPDRAPLLPNSPDFPHELYAGSHVTAYFSPGEKGALLPISNTEKSEWTGKKEWHKNTYAYASMFFQPVHSKKSSLVPDSESEFEQNEPLVEQNELFQNLWKTESHVFICNNKTKKVVHEERLNIQYVV